MPTFGPLNQEIEQKRTKTGYWVVKILSKMGQLLLINLLSVTVPLYTSVCLLLCSVSKCRKIIDSEIYALAIIPIALE